MRLHDVLDGVLVLNKGDDTYLCFTFGALKWVHFIAGLNARGPTTSPKLLAIVALLFFRRRRGELSALTSAATGVASIIPGQRFIGFWNMR